MGFERLRDGFVTYRTACEALERLRIVVKAQAVPRFLERPASEQRGGPGPNGTVPRNPVGLQVRAERNQFRQIIDGLDCPDFLDAHETVRVQVVAEQERGVPVRWAKKARPPTRW